MMGGMEENYDPEGWKAPFAEFLLARIAEDETAACPCCDEGPGSISYHLRREAEAKRRIVEGWRAVEEGVRAGLYRPDIPVGYRHAVRQLGTIYADHADYDEDWQP